MTDFGPCVVCVSFPPTLEVGGSHLSVSTLGWLCSHWVTTLPLTNSIRGQTERVLSMEMRL